MKKILSLVLAAALLLALAGCQTASNHAPDYAIILRSTNNPYLEKLAEGFEEAVTEMGGTCITLRPELATAEAQIALVEEAIELGVKGIAITANDFSELESVLHQARSAGIRIVSLDHDTKGSQLFVFQAGAEDIARAMMDAIYDLTGGEGQFAVLSGGSVAISSSPWSSAMQQLYDHDSKYSGLVWVETVYGDSEAERTVQETQRLLAEHPQLEVICSLYTEYTLVCAQTLASAETSVRVTGFGLPSEMKDFVLDGTVCPYVYLWDPIQMGSCTAYALEALCSGAVLEKGGILTTRNGSYTVYNGDPAQFQIHTGLPCQFNKENIEAWVEVY